VICGPFRSTLPTGVGRHPPRLALWCERITGFHLLKTKAGGSRRYRYQDRLGRRRVATLGRYPAKSPAAASEEALTCLNEKRDALAEQERERMQARQEAELAKTRTLRNYLDGPYSRHQSRKKTGDETLRRIAYAFADWLDRDIATLTAADVRTWQEAREKAGRAHASLQREFSAIKTLLNHATRQDPPVLEHNPLARVALERPAANARTRQLSEKREAARRLLTDTEIQALHAGLEGFAAELRAQRRNSRTHGRAYLPDLDLVAYPHWTIPFTYCALYTGVRPGDLYTLTWEEFNVTFGRLVKTPEKTRHHPDPARIVMDLPKAPTQIMHGWWEQQGKPQAGLVFPSPETGIQLDKKAHLRGWTRIKRLGGLPPDLAFYALRHHFVSALVAAGVPLLTVARLVGHKSASMIERNYGHLCPVAARDALAAFSATVAPAGARQTRGN